MFLALLKSEPKGSSEAKRHWDIGVAKVLAIKYLTLSNNLQEYKSETQRLEALHNNTQSGNLKRLWKHEKVLTQKMVELYKMIQKYASNDALMQRVFETLPPENPTHVMVGPIK